MALAGRQAGFGSPEPLVPYPDSNSYPDSNPYRVPNPSCAADSVGGVLCDCLQIAFSMRMHGVLCVGVTLNGDLGEFKVLPPQSVSLICSSVGAALTADEGGGGWPMG